MKLFLLGRKGDYSPIVRILEDIYQHLEHILGLSLTDTSRETFFLFLGIVRLAFVSKAETVVNWGINVTARIVSLLSQFDFTKEIYQFIIKESNYLPVHQILIPRCS